MNSVVVKFYGATSYLLHTKGADKKCRLYIFKFRLRDG